jgi:D-alanyl-lipoteichoic acid acyltransferase DltB (MBOAT superfamily)
VALCDGVESDENMQRCVLNNYSVTSFWRTWHTSFNRWLIRYLYIPLGGGNPRRSSARKLSNENAPTSPSSKSLLPHNSATIPLTTTTSAAYSTLIRLRNVFIVFGFVAFWHDRTLQLMTWGIFIALSFAPELFVLYIINSSSRSKLLRTKWYWRHIRALGATFNILLMVVGNLIGYSIGINGTFAALDSVFVDGNLLLYFGIFLSLFSASQLMFAIREIEHKIDEQKSLKLTSLD